jgi:glucokinase
MADWDLFFTEEEAYKGPVTDFDDFSVAGDVSATNVVLGAYGMRNGVAVALYRARYPGQKITDFGGVLDHFTTRGRVKGNVKKMVLAPAGAVSTDRKTCIMTRASFSLDTDLYNVPLARLINDFEAIGFAVAASISYGRALSQVDIPHTDGSLGEAVEGEMGAIEGPGTGLGVSRLKPEKTKHLMQHLNGNLYYPIKSEGGHRALAINPKDPLEVLVYNSLASKLKEEPHWEAAVCGQGIVDMYSCLINSIGDSSKSEAGFVASEQLLGELNDVYEDERPAYVAQLAKKAPDSSAGKAMNLFWRFAGRAARGLAVHEVAKRGVWIAGGIIRKNLYENGKDGKLDPNVVNPFMDRFDNGPSHNDWIRKIPVRAITDPQVGLKGALEVILTPEFMEKVSA